MARGKSLKPLSRNRCFRSVPFLISMSYLILGSFTDTAAQSLPQPPDLLSTARPSATTSVKSRAELERELLPLLLQEREMLKYCCSDHPKLLVVQGRIATVLNYLANLPQSPPEQIRIGTATETSKGMDGVRAFAKPSLGGSLGLDAPKRAGIWRHGACGTFRAIENVAHDHEGILPTNVKPIWNRSTRLSSVRNPKKNPPSTLARHYGSNRDKSRIVRID